MKFIVIILFIFISTVYGSDDYISREDVKAMFLEERLRINATSVFKFHTPVLCYENDPYGFISDIWRRSIYFHERNPFILISFGFFIFLSILDKWSTDKQISKLEKRLDKADRLFREHLNRIADLEFALKTNK